MGRDEYKETKVLRYACSAPKQIIQFNENGHPLYSSGTYPKYIKEDENSYIYVSDNAARVVVVVNEAGKLRFNTLVLHILPRIHLTCLESVMTVCCGYL